MPTGKEADVRDDVLGQQSSKRWSNGMCCIFALRVNGVHPVRHHMVERATLCLSTNTLSTATHSKKYSSSRSSLMICRKLYKPLDRFDERVGAGGCGRRAQCLAKDALWYSNHGRYAQTCNARAHFPDILDPDWQLVRITIRNTSTLDSAYLSRSLLTHTNPRGYP